MPGKEPTYSPCGTSTGSLYAIEKNSKEQEICFGFEMHVWCHSETATEERLAARARVNVRFCFGRPVRGGHGAPKAPTSRM